MILPQSCRTKCTIESATPFLLSKSRWKPKKNKETTQNQLKNDEIIRSKNENADISGYCSWQECLHLQVAFRQRWGTADRGKFLEKAISRILYRISGKGNRMEKLREIWALLCLGSSSLRIDGRKWETRLCCEMLQRNSGKWEMMLCACGDLFFG